MQDADLQYHLEAVKYNEEMMKFAKKLVREVKHPTVRGWVWSIADQHKDHLIRHRREVTKIRRKKGELGGKAISETKTNGARSNNDHELDAQNLATEAGVGTSAEESSTPYPNDDLQEVLFSTEGIKA